MKRKQTLYFHARRIRSTFFGVNMKNLIITSLSIILGVLLFSQSFQAVAFIKCKDKDGNWHMGDTIPPECVKTGYEEISEQGRVKSVQEREKTPEEIEEAKRLAAIEAEKQAKVAEQVRQDKILLDTFSNVDELEMSRDGKVAVIETRINLREKLNIKRQQDLEKRIQAAATAEQGGKNPNEALLKDIESLRRQIKNNEAFIEEKRKEQEMVRKASNDDIERFKLLKAAGK